MSTTSRLCIVSLLIPGLVFYGTPGTASAGEGDDITAQDETRFGARPATQRAQLESRSQETATTLAEQHGIDQGQATVTASGALDYSLPIEVIPGIKGVQPKLSVSVNSLADNGLLGAGGSLEGLPAIVRIPWGVHDSGSLVPRASTYEGRDTYAFSPAGYAASAPRGDRLVRLPGGEGLYHTIDESWTQYRAYGSCGHELEPCAWTARDGEGNTYYFGSNETAQLWERDAGIGQGRGVVAWGLSAMIDRHGNAYTVEYVEDEFVLRPDEIKYGCQHEPVLGEPNPGDTTEEDDGGGGGGGGGPSFDDPFEQVDVELVDPDPLFGTPWVNYPTTITTIPTVTVPPEPDDLPEPPEDFLCEGERWVRFVYTEERPDPTPAPVRYQQLLSGIRIGAEYSTVRGYLFGYQTADNGRSRLQTIRRLGDDDSTEHPPITFEWSSGTSGPDAFNATVVPWAMAWGDEVVETHIGDINSDGIDDVVRVAQSYDTRTIEYALGDRGVAGEGTVVLTPTTAGPFPEPSPSMDYWHSFVADVDGNGADDIVLWMVAKGRVGLEIIYAESTAGAVVFNHQTHPAVATLEAFVEAAGGADLDPRKGEDVFRLVPADFNGDQIVDLALVNVGRGNEDGQEVNPGDPIKRVALMRGGPGGPSGVAMFDGVAYNGLAQPSEPAVGDFNGDGLADLILTWSRPDGIRHNAFRGHAVSGMSTVDAFAWSGYDNGYQVYQPVVGDRNGDDKDDLTLAWTGEQDQPSGDLRGRDIRSLMGGAMQPSTFSPYGIPLVSGLRHVLDDTSFPGADPDTSPPRLGAWRHHAGDFNGDGFFDVASTYSGQGGDWAEVLYSAPNGRSPTSMTPLTDCAKGLGCSAAPDGDVGIHRWQYASIDVDDDGMHDLVRYYTGPSGTYVDLARGRPDGLQNFGNVFGDVSLVTVAAGNDAHHVTGSVGISAADTNGDARRELVVASRDWILHIPNKELQFEQPVVADLPVAINNGYGGRVEVDYRPLVAFPNAIDPDAIGSNASDCADTKSGPRPELCGIARLRSLPLAFEVQRSNGRGFATTARHDYTNGRYFPGPLVTSDPTDARADLAFAEVSRTDVETNTTTVDHYHQTRPLQRRMAKQETFAELEIGSAMVRQIARSKEREYEVHQTSFGTVDVRVQYESDTEYANLGSVSKQQTRSYAYDSLGENTSVIECGLTDCRETVLVYEEHETDPERWIVRRVAAKKMRPWGSNEHVLAWKAWEWVDDLVVSERSLVCDDAEQCECFEDAELCVSSGEGHWIVPKSDMQYDIVGNLAHVADALGRVTTMDYDDKYQTYLESTSRDVEVETLGGPVLETFTSSAYYDPAGRPILETDLNGGTTTSEYDALGRPVVLTEPNGRQTTWEYLDHGDPTSQRVRATITTNTGGETTWSEQWFDGMGGVHELRTPTEGTAISVRTRDEFFAGPHRIVDVSQPYFLAGGPDNTQFTRVEHDTLGRRLRVDRVKGAGTAVETNLGRQRDYLYTPGRLHTIDNHAELDVNGAFVGYDPKSTVVRYDGWGAVEHIETPETLTDYSYDEAGRVSEVVGPYGKNQLPSAATLVSSFEYDTLGRLKRSTDEATGPTELEYDDMGNVIVSVQSDGNMTIWTYDELDRISTRVDVDGVTDFTYDSADNGRGHLVRVEGSWGSEGVGPAGFDALGNALERTTTLAGLPGAQVESYGYDLMGRVTQRTMPDGTAIDYAYNEGGALRSVVVDEQEMLALGDFDAANRPGLRNTPADETLYWYTPDGFLAESLSTSTTGQVFLGQRYSHDGQGNVRSITDTRPEHGASVYVGITSTANDWDYEYDGDSRLAAAYHGVSVWDYEYDGAGNIERQGAMTMDYLGNQLRGWHTETPPCFAEYPNEPQCASYVVEDFLADYGARGQVTTKLTPEGRWRYAYDARDRIYSVTLDYEPVATFDHDASGRRVRKSVYGPEGTITTYYPFEGYEVRHSDQEPTEYVATRHIDAPGIGRIATVTDQNLSGAPTSVDVESAQLQLLSGGTETGIADGIWFLHSDHLGSTAVVTDAVGEVMTRYLREAYGTNLPSATGYDVVPSQFTGQERDGATGLMDYGARTYDPAMARFMTPDRSEWATPYLPGGPLKPSAMNRYAYVFNNPVRYTDPSGHDPIEFIKRHLGFKSKHFDFQSKDGRSLVSIKNKGHTVLLTFDGEGKLTHASGSIPIGPATLSTHIGEDKVELKVMVSKTVGDKSKVAGKASADITLTIKPEADKDRFGTLTAHVEASIYAVGKKVVGDSVELFTENVDVGVKQTKEAYERSPRTVKKNDRIIEGEILEDEAYKD